MCVPTSLASEPDGDYLAVVCCRSSSDECLCVDGGAARQPVSPSSGVTRPSFSCPDYPRLPVDGAVAKSARKRSLTAVQRQTCNRMARDSMPCKLRMLHGRLPEPSSRNWPSLPPMADSVCNSGPPSAFAIEWVCGGICVFFGVVAASRVPWGSRGECYRKKVLFP